MFLCEDAPGFDGVGVEFEEAGFVAGAEGGGHVGDKFVEWDEGSDGVVGSEHYHVCGADVAEVGRHLCCWDFDDGFGFGRGGGFDEG